MDIASLGIRVSSQGVDEAEKDLTDLAQAGSKVEKASGAAAKSISVAAKSSKELANATRMLGPQITDIVTGLASGQAPLTVLIQQGGQLKDVFGGIGPALRATAGYVAGLVSPLTIAGSVAAGLGLAWKQGQDESIAFNKALVTTGEYAGVSTGRLADMARSIAQVTGTQHAAAAALAEVASSGQFTAEQISLVGRAAVDMARISDQATGDTIRQFAALKDAPVDAVLKLNDAQHFLTASTYAQIKALDDQGRTQDAANVAMKAYADALDDRARQVQASAGIMERSWRTVASAAKGAWDAMLDVGRPETIDEKIKTIQQRMADVRDRNGPMYAGLTDRQQASILATYQRSLDDLQAKERQADAEASKKSIAARAVQALADSDREAEQYATREQKRVQAIARAHGEANKQVEAALAAGDKASADRIRANEAKIIAGINEQYKDPAPKRQKLDPDFYTEDRRQIEAEIAAEGKLFDQRTRTTAALAAYKGGLQELIQARANDIRLQVDAYGLGDRQIAQQQQLNQIYADAARKRLQLVHDMNQTTDQDTKDLYASELASLDQYTKQRIALEVDGFRQVDQAREDWRNGARSAYADILDDGKNVAAMTHDVFVNAYDGMTDSIANFVTSGKADFKSLATSILKDLARMETRILISQALMAIFGGGTSYAGGSMASIFDGGFSGFAKGDVFKSNSLARYANTIVDKPTPFMFAKGGALGVMGEAGPEAIMPLSRGSDGKLGVRMDGSAGGVVINVGVTVNSDGTSQVDASGDNQQFAKQFGQAMANAARQEIANALRPGGQIYNDRGRR